MSAEDVDVVARGRVWTGADALERGLVDELGGLRTAVRRAKVLAGLDEGTEVRIVSYPGTSLWDMVRPQSSSQPAAAFLGASLPDALGALLTRSVVGIIEHIEQTLSGASVLWLGESRF
jgi:protease-4